MAPTTKKTPAAKKTGAKKTTAATKKAPAAKKTPAAKKAPARGLPQLYEAVTDAALSLGDSFEGLSVPLAAVAARDGMHEFIDELSAEARRHECGLDGGLEASLEACRAEALHRAGADPGDALERARRVADGAAKGASDEHRHGLAAAAYWRVAVALRRCGRDPGDAPERADECARRAGADPSAGGLGLTKALALAELGRDEEALAAARSAGGSFLDDRRYGPAVRLWARALLGARRGALVLAMLEALPDAARLLSPFDGNAFQSEWRVRRARHLPLDAAYAAGDDATLLALFARLDPNSRERKYCFEHLVTRALADGRAELARSLLRACAENAYGPNEPAGFVAAHMARAGMADEARALLARGLNPREAPVTLLALGDDVAAERAWAALAGGSPLDHAAVLVDLARFSPAGGAPAFVERALADAEKSAGKRVPAAVHAAQALLCDARGDAKGAAARRASAREAALDAKLVSPTYAPGLLAALIELEAERGLVADARKTLAKISPARVDPRHAWPVFDFVARDTDRSDAIAVLDKLRKCGDANVVEAFIDLRCADAALA